MIKITITGAYGLVGTNLCNLIPRYFDEVELTKIKCDEIPKNLKKQEIIIHAAGYGQPLKFTQDKIKTIEINTKTTIELFKYLKPKGTFLFVSTSEVYSGAPAPYSENTIGTTNPSHPRACYIEGKRCGEAIVHSFADSFNVKIARLALAYGPGTKPHDTRVINQFIEQALVNRNISLKDAGRAVRTYCHVEDAAELMWKIILGGKDIVYNVGGFSTLSILELAEEIAKMTHACVTIPETNKGLEDAPEDVRLDMTKTLKEFPKGFINLYRGLKETIDYQRKLYGKD